MQDRDRRGEIVEPDDESPLAHAVATRDATTLSLVRRALARRDMILAFQPVVQSRHYDKVAFHEGLIRLMDETGRVIPAREFVGAIESDELGRLVDCAALELGFAALEESSDLRLSINMSARSIAYERWTETLRSGLRRDPTAGERLILEITESSAMVMPEVTGRFMRDMQRQGVSFALDDFGSGYTSFRYLRDFSFDAIKIDGQFIRDIHANPDNQCLAVALVSIAEHFDIFTIAEAVESAEDAAYVSHLGIDCQQGYFFGAPSIMPPWRARREAARLAG